MWIQIIELPNKLLKRRLTPARRLSFVPLIARSHFAFLPITKVEPVEPDRVGGLCAVSVLLVVDCYGMPTGRTRGPYDVQRVLNPVQRDRLKQQLIR